MNKGAWLFASVTSVLVFVVASEYLTLLHSLGLAVAVMNLVFAVEACGGVRK